MGPAPSGDSGVEGRVTIGPMCPVVQQGTECPDAPYSAALVVEDERGREVARIESSPDGSFRVALSPGTYQLVVQVYWYGDRIPLPVNGQKYAILGDIKIDE